MLMFTTASCEWSDGEDASPKSIGYELWSIARTDLEHVNSIFDFVACYNHLINIEDEAMRESYIYTYFHNAIISETGNVHTLTYNTSYHTNYTVTIEMYDTHWHITRSGGYGYDLTVTPNGNGRYTARFDKLYNNESTGEAEFLVDVTDTNYTHIISYTGRMKMIDPEASVRKPLTVTTEITNSITYSNPWSFTSGTLTVTAYDALYGTTDTAKITILEEHINRVVIECYGEVIGYDVY